MNKKLIYAVIGILIVSLSMPIFQFPIAGASENEWTTMRAMPTARGGLGVAVANVDGQDKIYAIGGLNSEGQLAVNEMYDPVNNTWFTKRVMPTARSGFAVAVYKNKIYCIGGTVEGGGFTGANEVYNPATDSWEIKEPMPTPRADLTANVVDGKIYLVGGKQYWGTELFYHELNVTEVYDPDTNTWTTNTSMPIPAFGYASAVVNDKIYVIGGTQLSGLTAIRSNQVYDVKNDTWSSQTNLPIAVSHAAACITSGATAPRRIYVVGGFDPTNCSNATRVYDFESNLWSSGAAMPTARAHLGLAVVDDALYAIGGFDGLNWLAVNERYLPIGYGTVPPTLYILSPENKTYPSNNIQLTFTVSRPTMWIGYSLDEQANVTVSGDTTLSELTEGVHSIKVFVNDTFGNLASSDMVYFSVDTTPPKILVLSPESKTYGETDIKLILRVDEPTSWMGCSLNGQDNVTITGNVTLAVLPEGSHSLIVYATDLVGNTGVSDTVHFVITPFPTVLVVGVAVTITIAVAATYLLLKYRKTIIAKAKR